MQKFHNTIQDTSGNVISTATVTVYLANSGTLATIYQDDETATYSNPFTVADGNYDADGNFFFKAAGSILDIKIVNGADTTWIYDVSFFDNDDRQLKNIQVNGILFNGDTSAGNTLDDYEEGTWTPSLGGTATYSVQSGVYTKIGNMVTVQCFLTVNVLGTGSTTTISGLPFSNQGVAPASGVVSQFISLAVSPVSLMMYIDTSAATLSATGLTSAASSTSALSIFGNSARVHVTATYQV